MDYCSAGDLAGYIRKRGDLVALSESNLGLLPGSGGNERGGSGLGRRTIYPHPEAGGLNETVVRCFVGQLSEFGPRLSSQEDS